MEENNNIDKLSASDVQKLKMNPPENAWNRLDAELARKQALIDRGKANRYRMLFIITGLLLLCSVSYLYFSHPGTKITATTPSPYGRDASRPYNEQKDVSSSATTAEVSGTKTKTEGQKGITNINTETKANLNKLSSPNQSVQKQKNILIVNSSKPVSVNRTERHTITNALKKQTGTITKTKDTDNVRDINPETTNTIATTIAKDNTTETVQPLINIPTSSNEEKNAGNTIVTGTTPEPDFGGGINIDGSRLPTLVPKVKIPDSVNTTETPVTTNDALPLNDPVGPSRYSRAKKILSRFSIAAAFSPDYSRNYLKETSSSNSYQLYSAKENFNFSYTTGLSVRYDLSNNLSVSLGGNYSTLAYSVSLPTIYAYTNSNNELHYFYPTACGVIEMPNSSTTAATYKGESLNTKASCSQVVKFINVPIMVRYQVALHKFTLYGNAGASANFTLQERANVIINNTETTVVNNIYGLKGMNYDFILGIGIQYNIYKGLSVFTGPDYRISINSLTENIPINCYPYSIGLNTGMSFHF